MRTLSFRSFKEKYKNLTVEEAKAKLEYFKTLLNPPSNQKIKFIQDIIDYKDIRDSSESNEKEVKQEVKEKPFQVLVAEKYIQLYKSAMKRNKEFNLDVRDVGILLRKKKCFYTDIHFESTPNNHRTIDRVDNTKGYVKGNVVAATHFANQYKNDMFERPSNELDVNIKHLYNIVSKVEEFTKGE